MQKLILLFTVILFLTSCSTNEEQAEVSNEDLIIGTWRPVLLAQFPIDGNTIIEEVGECSGKTRITFKSNGELINEFYGNDHGECTSNVYYQTWEKLSSGSYIFKEQQTNMNGETSTYSISPDKITFPDSNTMRIRYNRNYDQEIELEYYYNEFDRQ